MFAGGGATGSWGTETPRASGIGVDGGDSDGTAGLAPEGSSETGCGLAASEPDAAASAAGAAT